MLFFTSLLLVLLVLVSSSCHCQIINTTCADTELAAPTVEQISFNYFEKEEEDVEVKAKRLYRRDPA